MSPPRLPAGAGKRLPGDSAERGKHPPWGDRRVGRASRTLKEVELRAIKINTQLNNVSPVLSARPSVFFRPKLSDDNILEWLKFPSDHLIGDSASSKLQPMTPEMLFLQALCHPGRLLWSHLCFLLSSRLHPGLIVRIGFPFSTYNSHIRECGARPNGLPESTVHACAPLLRLGNFLCGPSRPSPAARRLWPHSHHPLVPEQRRRRSRAWWCSQECGVGMRAGMRVGGGCVGCTRSKEQEPLGGSDGGTRWTLLGAVCQVPSDAQGRWGTLNEHARALCAHPSALGAPTHPLPPAQGNKHYHSIIA